MSAKMYELIFHVAKIAKNAVAGQPYIYEKYDFLVDSHINKQPP